MGANHWFSDVLTSSGVVGFFLGTLVVTFILFYIVYLIKNSTN